MLINNDCISVGASGWISCRWMEFSLNSTVYLPNWVNLEANTCSLELKVYSCCMW